MVLLGALTGFPNLGAQLLAHLHRRAAETPDMNWTAFLDELRPTGSQTLANAVDSRLSPTEAEAWGTLGLALGNINERAGDEGIDLPDAISQWASWIPLVGRLYFSAGSVVSRLSRTGTVIPTPRVNDSNKLTH